MDQQKLDEALQLANVRCMRIGHVRDQNLQFQVEEFFLPL